MLQRVMPMMVKVLQILTLLVTLLLVLLLGATFEAAYWQAAIRAEETLGDVPIPFSFTFFSENHRALFYILVAPWIGLVGLPLVVGRNDYFASKLFLLRFALFASIEALLSVLLTIFLLLPFVPIYMVLETRSNTVLETVVIQAFWISIVVILLFLGRRRLADRRHARVDEATEDSTASSQADR